MQELIHGAKWWKFDFHNHTPASSDFGKDNIAHKSITPESWLLMYMRAEIDCVAITDHNSGEWIDTLKAALEQLEAIKPAGYRKLYLFPGVEITASGNTHILAIFDTDTETKKIQALLGAVGFPPDATGTSEAVTTKSVEEVISEIHRIGGIAIPAHADKPCGLFKKQDGFTLKQTLAAEGLLALEIIDKTEPKPEIYLQSKLELAEVIGTDSHIPEQVGTAYTWVKMSEPSLDALKLALHDKEDGIIRKEDITNNPNTVTNRYFIKSLTVKSGFRAGNGVALKTEFSPWLTSVIGGRGSGKSTILNYLRIAFARTDEMPNEVQREFDRFNTIGSKSSTGMLRDSTDIEVEIYKDEKLFSIEWCNNVHKLKEWNSETSDWNEAIVVSNIKELFPIQIFNQKELYTLTSNPSKLIELIDSQFDKSAWSEAKDLLVNQWIAKRAKGRQLTGAIAEETNIRAQLGSVNNKIAIFESSEYRETLNKFNKYTEVSSFLTNTKNFVTENFNLIKDTQEAIQSIEIPDAISNIIVDDSLSLVQQLNNATEQIKTKLTEAFDIISPFYNDIEAKINNLAVCQEIELSKQAYSAIATSIQQLGTENYEALIKRRTILTEKISLIESQKNELITLNAELDNLYNAIINKEKELRQIRNVTISRWRDYEDPNNPFLIIELLSMSDEESANKTFRDLLRKSGGEFANDIYYLNEENSEKRGLIGRIVVEDEATKWDKRESEIREFLSATEADKKNIDLRLAKHLDTLRQNTPEDIDRLLIWVPEDKLVLKFKKQGREEDIQTGSAGERTAGMLGLLLALNNIPLIIDQPEDDLDTKLISKFVVEGFKKLKKVKQLIIVTHNPNIAVNANSDNINIWFSIMDKLQKEEIMHYKIRILEMLFAM